MISYTEVFMYNVHISKRKVLIAVHYMTLAKTRNINSIVKIHRKAL